MESLLAAPKFIRLMRWLRAVAAAGMAAVTAVAPASAWAADETARPWADSRAWSYATLSVATFAGLGGLGLTLTAKSNYDLARAGTLPADQLTSVQGAAKSFDLGADALYVTAGIFAVAGIYLFIESHDAIPGPPVLSASLGVAPLRQGGMVSFHLSF